MSLKFRRILLAVFIFSVFGLGYAAKILLIKEQGLHQPSAPRAYTRIVSLAPNITETLFALGLGERVAGVTRYCKYPPEAAKKEKIGGYYDQNYEAIVSLRPDIVVMLPEHKEVGKRLSGLGFNTLAVDNKTINDILDSINTIGRACGAEEMASELVDSLRKRIEAVRGRTANLKRPRTLVLFARGMDAGIKTVYAAGRGGYYDELIEIAGGINAYRDEKIKFPAISREGLIALNPDVILELVPSDEKKGWSEAAMLKEWEALSGIKAVKHGMVYVLSRDYLTVPGPRFILLLEDMTRAIHPDIRQ